MSLLDRFVVRDKRDADEDDTLARRLSMLPMADFPMWVDNTISQTGKAVQAYLRDGSPENLEEAKLSAQSLVAMINEMERRTAPPT